MNKVFKPPSKFSKVWFRPIKIDGTIDACIFGLIPLTYIKISLSHHILYHAQYFMFSMVTPFMSLVFMLDDSFEVLLEKSTIYIPGWELMRYPERVMITPPSFLVRSNNNDFLFVYHDVLSY